MTENAEFLSEEEIRHIQDNYKIPVDSFNPGTYWIVSLERESFMPTDRELKQMQSLREYMVRNLYNEHYLKKILEMPLPACGGHNTTIFRKGLRHNRGGFNVDDGHWFYRQCSWEIGPLYVPDVTDKNYQGLSLVQVMGRSRSIMAERWTKWKKDHANIFG